MPDYLLGLDLGQSSDPTALAVVKRSLLIDSNGLPARNHCRDLLYEYVCVHLVQFRLGTSYPEIVADVAVLASNPRLQPKPRLAIDATGVGRPVVDMFLNQPMPVQIVPVTITAGDSLRHSRWNRSDAIGHWVPKHELISAVQAALQSQRFKVVPSLQFADTLRRELIDFRVTVTRSAHETFAARAGAHDDLVLSVAMPLWLGTRKEFALEILAKADGDAEQRALAHEASLEEQTRALAEARERAQSEGQWHDPDNPAFF